MIGLGVLVNTGSIIAGGFIGHLFGNVLKESLQDSLKKTCGLCTIFVSIAGAMEGMLSIDNSSTLISGKSVFIIICMASGTLLGEIANLDGLIERFGEWLKKISGNAKDADFVNAFVTASLTVCIGAMALVGSIQDGLAGDHSVLFVKSLLDFIIIAVMTVSMGKGCVFSAIPVLLLEGSVTLLARFISPVLTEPMINAMSLTGALLIFCVGVNLVWGNKFKVANMLPAVIISAIIAPLFSQ